MRHGMVPGILGLMLCAGCFPAVSDSAHATDGLKSIDAAAPCAFPANTEEMLEQVLQLVNLERVEGGLAPVARSATLEQVAGGFACRMIDEGFFGHLDPTNGDGPAKRAFAGAYRFYAVGENLAAGYESPVEVMKVWMASPSHREIILDPKWREVGIAVRTGGEYGVYWVQEFGEPADWPTSE